MRPGEAMVQSRGGCDAAPVGQTGAVTISGHYGNSGLGEAASAGRYPPVRAAATKRGWTKLSLIGTPDVLNNLPVSSLPLPRPVPGRRIAGGVPEREEVFSKPFFSRLLTKAENSSLDIVPVRPSQFYLHNGWDKGSEGQDGERKTGGK